MENGLEGRDEVEFIDCKEMRIPRDSSGKAHVHHQRDLGRQTPSLRRVLRATLEEHGREQEQEQEQLEVGAWTLAKTLVQIRLACLSHNPLIDLQIRAARSPSSSSTVHIQLHLQRQVC
jgi:hypothetical protein